MSRTVYLKGKIRSMGEQRESYNVGPTQEFFLNVLVGHSAVPGHEDLPGDTQVFRVSASGFMLEPLRNSAPGDTVSVEGELVGHPQLGMYVSAVRMSFSKGYINSGPDSRVEMA